MASMASHDMNKYLPYGFNIIQYHPYGFNISYGFIQLISYGFSMFDLEAAILNQPIKILQTPTSGSWPCMVTGNEYLASFV